MNKNMMLFDKDTSIKDKYSKSCVKDTMIEVFIEGTDICVFRGSNKCVIAGAETMANKLFQVGNDFITPTYNDKLDLDLGTGEQFLFNGKTVTDEAIRSSLIAEATKTYLFAVGTDGCGTDAASVYNVPYVSWIDPNHMVPFQYRSQSLDLIADERTKYFGKKKVTSNGANYCAYYFKAFDNITDTSTATLKRVYTNGNDVTSELYNKYEQNLNSSESGAGNFNDIYSNTIEEAETYVKLQLTITSGGAHPDCREWFTTRNASSISSSNARINTISLISGYPVVGTDPDTGIKCTYYKNLRPITKLNIPNESLIDVTKGLTISYYIYF